MDPEISLPHSQLLATSSYPEPDQSSPCPTPLPEDPSQYYPPIYAWVLQVASFPLVSPPKLSIRLSSFTYALHALPISFSILLQEQYLVSSTHHLAVQIIKQYRSLSSSLCSFLHCPITSSLLAPNIPLNTLFSNTLSPRSSFNVSAKFHIHTKQKVKQRCTFRSTELDVSLLYWCTKHVFCKVSWQDPCLK